MTLFPLIERELRVRARTGVTYWTRFGVALAGILTCFSGFVFAGRYGSQADIGRSVFTGIVGVVFVLSCASCLLTADAIGAERREGTLGLLFLTRVKDIDVLLGKFASNGTTCLLALVAFLPMLMLPVMAGGVTGGETFRTGLALLDTLFLALAAGLWVSVRGHEKLEAARNSVLLVAGAVLVPALLGWGFRSAGGWPDFELVSPLVTLSTAADAAYKISAARCWISLLLVALAGTALLLSALVNMRVRLREDALADSRATVAARPHLEDEPLPALGPRRSLEDEPSAIHWAIRRQRGVKAVIWVGALVKVLPFALQFIIVWFARTSFYFAISMSLSLATTVIEGSLFAWAASRFFVESRRNGELELLLTTPLGAQQILSAQWDILKRSFRWPVFVLLAPMLLQAAFLQTRVSARSIEWRVYDAVSSGFTVINTLVGIYALCWLALWFGLKARNQARAILWTVGLARGVPYVFSITLSLLSIAFFRFGTSSNLISWNTLMSRAEALVSHAVVLAFYFWLVRLARRNLLHDLSGVEPIPFSLRRSMLETGRNIGVGFAKVRHWTPGEEIRKKSEEQNPNSGASPSG